MAEGHKASFCLEDNHCSGVDPKYDCENYGDQVSCAFDIFEQCAFSNLTVHVDWFKGSKYI